MKLMALLWFILGARPLPTGDDPALRNEGVGIVMSSAVAMVSRISGEC